MDGDPLANAVFENAKHVAEQIRARAEFGEKAGDVRILTAVYDLDTGVVAWARD
jgi:hypothetical protein